MKRFIIEQSDEEFYTSHSAYLGQEGWMVLHGTYND